jgi:virginiamycin B lyase
MKIARYTLASEKWDFFDIGMYPHSAMIDSGGRVWFNGHFTKDPELFGYVDADGDTTQIYEVSPSGRPEEEGGTIPYGLRVAPDGTVWGTELTGNRLIRFDPRTEQIKVYDMPSPHSGPRRLDIARDGTVWVPEYAANKLARFDPASESFTEYEFPTANSLPYCARIDHERGRIWISQTGHDAIAGFDIEREEFVEYRLPSHIAFIRHLDVDQKTGVVWGACSQSPGVHPRIVRLDPGR